MTEAEHELYERVHTLRLERGLRHRDCADALGLGTREAFRQRRRFTVEELGKLATLFGLPLGEAFPHLPEELSSANTAHA